MFIRQLHQDQYDILLRYLQQRGYSSPLDASYEVSFQVDHCDYRLPIQPSHKRRIAVLQAVRIQSQQGEPLFQLITDSLPLSCLLELLLLEQKLNKNSKKTCYQPS
ncbi:MAG: hypothetical protein E7L17_04930 [Clostridium sp.]|uniref:hypothetical protein n=1 Tax=Clostridium sp. TaxID=1506 RepID=UPI00290D0709|nr:hypothetical protein [Clostridium sp.]MDU7337442.1 hypothetical protein [Clostridium sp.]